MREEIKELALAAKGFLAEKEGLRLFELAAEGSRLGPCLEIGAYCGKSTLFLAEGCRLTGKHPLFTIDHHRGSPEQQPGELYFDQDLYNDQERTIDTLPFLMTNLRKADLQDWVIPVVAESTRVGAYWRSASLGLVFIDGGHSEEDAFGDYRVWSPQVVTGGYLCIHDIYRDPADGGQAPLHVLLEAQASGKWRYCGQTETLGVLRRL